MGNDGTINVFFHNAGGDDGYSVNDISQTTTESTGSVKSGKNEIARSAIISASIQAGKQFMAYGFNVMADLTGDYMSAYQFSEMSNIASIGMQMMNFPVGTLMGIGQIALNSYNKGLSQYKSMKETDLYRARSGNETYNNSEVD